MDNKFLSAAKGLRLLKTANILGVISSIIAVFGTLTFLFSSFASAGFIMNESADLLSGALITAGIAGVVAIIGFIINLVAGIIKLVSLAKVSKLNKGYNYALIIVIVEIILPLIIFMFTLPLFVNYIVSAVGYAITFSVIYFIINATVELLREKGNLVVVEKGLKVRTLYLISTVGLVVCYIAQLIPAITAIFSSVSMIFSIIQLVALFRFIGFLGKSAAALEE